MKIIGKQIEDKLPLFAYENNILISKKGDMTALYEITLPEIFSSGKEDFDNMHSAWQRAIRSLPDYYIVHKQDIFFDNIFKAEEKKEITYLTASSNKHFRGRRFLAHSCLVYVTQCNAKTFITSSSSSPLNVNQFIIPDNVKLKRTAEQDFLSSVASFISILKEANITARQLTEDEVIGSPDKFGIIEKYINLDFSKKSTLNDINITDTEFLIGDKYVSLYSIGSTDDMPQEVSTFSRHNKFSSDNVFFAVGYVSNLNLQLPFSHIYNQYFFLENQDKILKEVDSLSKHQASLSAVSRENAVNMEYNVEFIDDVTRNASRPVRCAFNVILWDNNYLTLQKKNTIVSARLASLDITATKTERIVPQIFWSGIPGASSYFPKEMRFITCLEQGCCMINYESNSKTSTTGFGIRLCDRINGIPLNVDISDEPMSNGWTNNRNKFILGPSGSGKSFFTNHMVRQYYEQGTHVVIVDVGDSYLGLCKQINQETGGKDGVYYTYTEENPIKFNPFYVADNRYTIEKREQLSNLIFVLWKGESQYSKAEETHVSTAINNYIDKCVVTGKVKASFNTFYEYLITDMKEYVKKEAIRIENFDIDNLCQVLKPYYKGGRFDYLLNAEENINLIDKRFIVFEIDNIKDHPTLFPVVTLVLMDTFLSKMRHPSIGKERKMILIEEAWKAISKQGTAEFIKYLYKTVRKHFGEAIVVTQEVDDIIENPIVKEAIISNADCKILLDQRKYQNKFEVVQKVLALTNKESAIALSVNKDLIKKNRPPYKEVFISLNGNHTAVYAVEVSRQEYLTYTTEKREKVRLYELEKQTGSMANAIEAYIKEENIKK